MINITEGDKELQEFLNKEYKKSGSKKAFYDKINQYPGILTRGSHDYIKGYAECYVKNHGVSQLITMNLLNGGGKSGSFYLLKETMNFESLLLNIENERKNPTKKTASNVLINMIYSRILRLVSLGYKPLPQNPSFVHKLDQKILHYKEETIKWVSKKQDVSRDYRSIRSCDKALEKLSIIMERGDVTDEICENAWRLLVANDVMTS